MRLRRAQILARRGILFLATDKPDKAARVFRQALIDRSDDLGSMTYLGQALLNAKRYEAAQEAFKVVLDKAPGNVESLIGSARASIEIADDGDIDQYEIAEKLLTKSIRFGREGGSTKLGPNDLADVYSMRGYARAKLYDGDKSGFHPFLITMALRDFRQARKLNPNHGPAQSACKKIVKEITRRTRDSVSDVIGTVLVSVAAAMVFVFAQVDFFLRGSWLHHVLGLPAKSILEQPSYYATVTFGALALMIAGVSLGKLLKLKVGGIELEKASADQFAPATVLDIGRFGLFENFVLTGLRGLAANVNDVPPQAAGREGQSSPRTEKYRGSSEHSTSEATRNQGPKPER
jgi:tetratricopeptide (TPR) repeat protein